MDTIEPAEFSGSFKVDGSTDIGVAVNSGGGMFPQSFFDNNRKVFGAATTAVTNAVGKCNHALILKGDREVGCKFCSAGWYFSAAELVQLRAEGLLA